MDSHHLYKLFVFFVIYVYRIYYSRQLYLVAIRQSFLRGVREASDLEALYYKKPFLFFRIKVILMPRWHPPEGWHQYFFSAGTCRKRVPASPALALCFPLSTVTSKHWSQASVFRNYSAHVRLLHWTPGSSWSTTNAGHVLINHLGTCSIYWQCLSH